MDAELWRFPDRTTAIGKMINSYLTSQSEIDDAAVHLLFSANRWEKRCGPPRKSGRALWPGCTSPVEANALQFLWSSSQNIVAGTDSVLFCST